MIERLSRGKRNLALTVVFVLIAWFAWSIRSVLNPVLVGYLCAYILHPIVLRVEQLGFSRRAAVNITFISGFLLATAIGLLIVLQLRSLAFEMYRGARGPAEAEAPVAADGTASVLEGETSVAEGEELATLAIDDAEPAAPEEGRPSAFVERLQERLDEFCVWAADWGVELPPITVDEPGLRAIAQDVIAEYQDETAQLGIDAAGRGFQFLSRFAGKLASLAGMFVLLPLYAYYFLFVQKDMNDFVRRYLPKRERDRLVRVAGQVGEVIANFFRGRLGVCFLKGVILSVGLWIAGIEYAFLFGMLSGFLSVIPFFGPFLGFLLAFTVGILEHGVVWSLVRTGIVFGVGELLEGYVLLPKILGDSLGLHPLVVFVALLAGGAALGMFGIIIALPVTASAVILVKEFVLPALRDFAEEDPTPA